MWKPAIILIAFPSFKLLFLTDDVTDPHIYLGITRKIINVHRTVIQIKIIQKKIWYNLC